MPIKLVTTIFALALLLGPARSGAQEPTTRPAGATTETVTLPVGAAPPSGTTGRAAVDPPSYVLHLPGIGGARGMDRALVRGLQRGGVTEAGLYDWTERNPGLNALVAQARNREQARKVAAMITARARANPGTRIHLVSHSGGTGVAVWALESLPPGVKVDTVTLLSSALSPTYDLSGALRHVERHAYAFTSLNDTLVLSVGTQMFGTIDGPKVTAGGRDGFVIPPAADRKQYEKFTQFPYDPVFMNYNNIGDHIGPMNAQFAQGVLAPLILHDKLPPKSPVTRPATKPATAPVQ